MTADHSDYAAFLAESGFSESFVRAVSDDMSDHIDAAGVIPACVRPSRIQGVGVFATEPLDEGELIGPTRVRGRRTFLGRRMNHSAAPNCVVCPVGRDLVVVTSARVLRGDEMTVDYRQALRANIEAGRNA